MIISEITFTNQWNKRQFITLLLKEHPKLVKHDDVIFDRYL